MIWGPESPQPVVVTSMKANLYYPQTAGKDLALL